MQMSHTEFYQSPQSEFDSDYASLSIESQQQLSGPGSAGKFSVQQSPSITLPAYNAAQKGTTLTEEYSLLNQLLAENGLFCFPFTNNFLAEYLCFGFIMDSSGTIESISGHVEKLLGLNAVCIRVF